MVNGKVPGIHPSEANPAPDSPFFRTKPRCSDKKQRSSIRKHSIWPRTCGNVLFSYPKKYGRQQSYSGGSENSWTRGFQAKMVKDTPPVTLWSQAPDSPSENGCCRRYRGGLAGMGQRESFPPPISRVSGSNHGIPPKNYGLVPGNVHFVYGPAGIWCFRALKIRAAAGLQRRIGK
jgi:hypothetical protein